MDKKLYRCRDGRILFGVCCGLARYFDLDPVIVRLVFALSLFIPPIGGAAFLTYIILAIIIPVEGSVTVTTKQTVKENLNDIKETANDLGDKIRTNIQTEGASNDDRIRRRNNILTLIGGFLIVVGLLALLSSLNIFWWFRWEYFGPAVLIIIGVLFIISTNRRK
jgi:phage shock protein C